MKAKITKLPVLGRGHLRLIEFLPEAYISITEQSWGLIKQLIEGEREHVCLADMINDFWVIKKYQQGIVFINSRNEDEVRCDQEMIKKLL